MRGNAGEGRGKVQAPKDGEVLLLPDLGLTQTAAGLSYKGVSKDPFDRSETV